MKGKYWTKLFRYYEKQNTYVAPHLHICSLNLRLLPQRIYIIEIDRFQPINQTRLNLQELY